jgi:hypothetical protein
MGYVCPVCEDPQADGHHLANHLAFTAMLGDDAHAAWLDEHAPEWADSDPDALADTVVEDAEETEYPQVFEDTTGDESDGHAHGDGPGHGAGQADTAGGVPDDVAPAGVTDPDTLFEGDDAAERSPDDVLAEARELTRQRRENADRGADNGDVATDGVDDADTDGTDDADTDGTDEEPGDS